MFYMPQYHNLPDGRQVFLRFPDPARHADGVSALLEGIPGGEEGAAFLSEANAHPMRLVLVAEIAGEYDVSIPAEELLPENFNSAKALYALIERLMEE